MHSRHGRSHTSGLAADLSIALGPQMRAASPSTGYGMPMQPQCMCMDRPAQPCAPCVCNHNMPHMHSHVRPAAAKCVRTGCVPLPMGETMPQIVSISRHHITFAAKAGMIHPFS
jgi:hypothetical protein